jgi:hypothetical protein
MEGCKSVLPWCLWFEEKRGGNFGHLGLRHCEELKSTQMTSAAIESHPHTYAV